MAGGPFLPSSVVYVDPGKVFPSVHTGAGANSKHDEGHGVMASLSADATLRLRILIPPAIPTGTAKLKLRTLANATSGAAKVNPKCAKVADTEDPSSAALTALGTQTLTWAAGENDKYKIASVDLTTIAIAAADVGKELIVDLVFETSGFTLTQVSTWRCWLVWE